MKAVIFDMDGVMIDSEPLWDKAFFAIIKNKCACNCSYETLKKQLTGKTMAEAAEVLKRAYNYRGSIEELNAERKSELIAVCEKEMKLEKGFRTLLGRMKKAGLKLAIASGSPEDFIDYVTGKFGLAGFFDVMLSCDRVGKGKPAPDIFLVTAEKLGVAPADCIVIEDSANGAEAARRAGMKCVIFKRPYANVDSADFIINNFAEFSMEWLHE